MICGRRQKFCRLSKDHYQYLLKKVYLIYITYCVMFWIYCLKEWLSLPQNIISFKHIKLLFLWSSKVFFSYKIKRHNIFIANFERKKLYFASSFVSLNSSLTPCYIPCRLSALLLRQNIFNIRKIKWQQKNEKLYSYIHRIFDIIRYIFLNSSTDSILVFCLFET